MALPDGGVVQQSDYEPLEKIAGKIIKEKQPFERLSLSKDELLEMFKSNKYKQYIIKDKIPDGSSTTVYRCGPLIDLCRGPLNQVYFTIKPQEGIQAKSFQPGAKFYIGGDKLLPLEK